VAGVVPDHDAVAGPRAVRQQVRRQAGRRAGDHDPVHPHRAGAQRAAQPGGAELEGAGEPVGQLDGRGAAGIGVGGRDQLLELGAGAVVRVLGGPGAGAVQQLGHRANLAIAGEHSDVAHRPGSRILVHV
jgi:hypothetical protein